MQIFSAYYSFGTGAGDEPTIRHGYILIVFSACMILGAAVTHFWIPAVQVRGAGAAGTGTGAGAGAGGKRRGQFWGGRTVELEVLALGRMEERSLYSAWYLGGSSGGGGGSPFGGMGGDGI